MNNTPAHVRFREARERLGLSPDEVAANRGISQASVWDIEMCEGDLTGCYSPAQIRKFCEVLQIHPCELFGEKITESPVSAEELVKLIEDECSSNPSGRWAELAKIKLDLEESNISKASANLCKFVATNPLIFDSNFTPSHNSTWRHVDEKSYDDAFALTKR